MIPKYRFWHIAEKKMYEVVSIHLMTGMVEVEGGKYFLIPQDGFLMKFIGLFDKNGVEIFEGDLLKMDDGSKRLIKVEAIESGNFAVKVFLSTKQSAYIAGNIHEHPHLVEVVE